MLNGDTVRRTFLFAALLGMVFSTCLLAQQKGTLTRLYEPVAAAAGTLTPLTGDSISVYTAYRYNADLGVFERIPFQIDEVGTKGDYLQETDAVADSNDEVVFMPGDVRDQAPADKWIDGSDSTRLELEVINPGTNEKGWIYLFRHVKTPAPVKPYVRYAAGPSGNAGADTVYGSSYAEAHDASGWFTYTAIPSSAGGDGLDILDRQKVRVGGFFQIGPIKLPVTLKEDVLQLKNVRPGGGPVRILRELTSILVVQSDTISVPVVTQYFQYNRVFSIRNVTIGVISGLTINLARLSLDFNDHASGMRFFNPFGNNRNGLLIDGQQDAFDNSLPDGLNWYMVTGNPGTFVVLVSVPVLGEKRELYYKDNQTVDNDDTGDLKSYGDSGLLVTTTTNITGSLSFDFTTYYLARNQTVDVGDQFKQRALNPLQVTAKEQTRKTSAVSENTPQPTDFGLFDAQPNPFSPLLGNVRIRFNLVQNNLTPSLRIFNLLGQEVARFEGADLLRNQEILWNGRDRFGRLLPAGVYFYQLEFGRQRAVKKLVLLR
jgi:hypothetical protein